MKKINVKEAEKMVIEGEERENFEKFLASNGKKPHEWDYDDLGEFFRSKGIETE